MPVKGTHVHKLKRFTYKNGTKVYFCTLPDCGYKVAPEFSLGKKSICNICNSEFLLNEYSIRLAKPRCEKCHKRKGAVNADILAGAGAPKSSTPESKPVEQQQEPEDLEFAKPDLKEKLFKSIEDIVSHAKDSAKKCDDIL